MTDPQTATPDDRVFLAHLEKLLAPENVHCSPDDLLRQKQLAEQEMTRIQERIFELRMEQSRLSAQLRDKTAKRDDCIHWLRLFRERDHLREWAADDANLAREEED